MSSELQLSLLLKRQVEDVINTQIYDRNSRASLLAWREYREEIRKRVLPKGQETGLTQESDDFTLSPYKNYLTKYKENLSQQKYLRELQSEVYSPRSLANERSVSASTLKRSQSISNIEKVFPMKTLVKLESVISRSNLNKSSREYCMQLQELANTIVRKLRE